MAALVLLAALLWAARMLLGGGATWKVSPMHLPVALFTGYAVLRYFTSPFEHDARLELIQVLICAVVYFVAASQFYRPTDRAILLWSIVALVVFECSYGLWQCTSRADKIFNWVRPEGYHVRAGGTFVCPNNFATFLEMCLGLLLAYGLIANFNPGRSRTRAERAVILRLTILYAALMAVVGIIASFSRAGWAVTLAGLLFFAFWGRSGTRIPWGKLIGITVVGGLMALAAWKVGPVRDYIQHTLVPDPRRGEDKVILRDPSFGGRKQMWMDTTRLIASKPLFGTGIGTWQWVYQKVKDPLIQDHPEHTHNDFLHVASDYGLIGFGLLVWVFVGFYRQARLMHSETLPSEQRAFAIGSAVGVTSALLHAWFDFPFHIQANSLLLAILLGTVAAMDDPKQKYPRRPMPDWARYSVAGAILFLAAVGVWRYLPTARGVYYAEAGNIAKFQYVLNRDVPLGLYHKAIQADPNHPMPHWKTADIYRSQAVWLLGPDKAAERKRMAESAIPYYQRALELNPLLNEVLLRQGAAFELAGQDDRALSNYLRAVEVSPVNAFNHHILGRYYRDRGDTNRAYIHYARAHKLNSASDSSSQINMNELEPAEATPDVPAPATNAPVRATP